MSRKLSELKKEAEECGLKVVSEGRVGKDEYEIALRDFYWQRDHAGEKMVTQFEPQLAQNIKDLTEEEQTKYYNSPDYIAQEKLDGARFTLQIIDGKAHFTSRRKSDKTYLFSEKTANFTSQTRILEDAEFLKKWDGLKADGEMKAPYSVVDTGKTVTRGELQATIAITNSGPEVALKIQLQNGSIVYHIFNVISMPGRCAETDGEMKRFKVALELLQDIRKLDPAGKVFKLVNIYTGDDKRGLFEAIVKAGGEGAMLKRKDAPFRQGKRAWDWIKCKRYEEVDCFVTGFLRGEPGNAFQNMVGALVVSAYGSDEKLYEVASVPNMTVEFRKSISEYDADTDTVTLRKDVYNRVIVVRGQQWSKNLRIGMAKMMPYKSQEDPWRDDKPPHACTFNSAKIKETLAAGMRI